MCKLEMFDDERLINWLNNVLVKSIESLNINLLGHLQDSGNTAKLARHLKNNQYPLILIGMFQSDSDTYSNRKLLQLTNETENILHWEQFIQHKITESPNNNVILVC